MSTRPPEPRDTLSEQPTPAAPTTPRYAAEQLFAGARQVIIVHGGREYCLRLTAANKLILTA
jgi:hemin uptake protein HemP